MTDPGRMHSLHRHICVQLPKAHTLEACSEASHNQQAVHIVFGLDPRDSWRLLHVKHLSLSSQPVPDLRIKKIPFKAQRWPEC